MIDSDWRREIRWPSVLECCANGKAREAHILLDARETFLHRREAHATVQDQGGRGVVRIEVDPEHVHCEVLCPGHRMVHRAQGGMGVAGWEGAPRPRPDATCPEAAPRRNTPPRKGRRHP